MYTPKPFLENIPQFVQRLVRSGTNDQDEITFVQRTVFVNTIALITGITVIVVGSLFYWTLRSPFVAIPAVLESMLFFAVIGANALQLYRTAGVLLFITHCVFANYFGVILGQLIPIHLMVVFLMLAIPLIFPDKLTRTICLIAAIIAMLSFQIINYFDLLSSFAIARPHNFVTDFLPMLGSVALIYLVGRSYIRRIIEYSERLQLMNDRLENLNRQLETANQHKRVFLRGTIHDVRSYLNAINGVAQLFKRNASLDSRLQEYTPLINDLYASCQGVKEEVNDVLDMETIESGKADQVRKESFKAIPFIESILTIARINGRPRNVTVRLATRSVCPPVMFDDQLKLRKILTNLLVNAVKFADSGSQVTLKITPGEKDIAFQITNYGNVIPAHQLGDIFNPFVSASPAGVGTGLGLFIVKNKVDLLGGTIEVTSRDQRTTFTVTLPFTPGLETAAPEEEIQPGYELESYIVLAVEDNILSATLLENFLSGWGCRVHIAKDGAQGFQLAQQLQPDLVLLDAHLPDMSGWDVLASLKQTIELKDIPVIITSGEGFDEQQLELSGADAYLLKPIAFQQLRTEMGRLLNSRSPSGNVY